MSLGTCQETAGFLFKHPCGRAATEECADCGKPVCPRHLKRIEGVDVCISCARALLDKKAAGEGQRGRGRRSRRDAYERYADDPYFYGYYHYEGYGSYRRGEWGHSYYRSSRHHDADDFTEADGESFSSEGDETWEHDMDAS